MKIKKIDGHFYVHFKTEHGARRLKLDAISLPQAKQLVKDAKVAELEHAASVKALTAQTISRITAGRNITCSEALTLWAEWAETVGLTPNTRERYRTYINAFFNAHGMAKRPPSAIKESHLNAFINPVDSVIGLASRQNRLAALQSFFLVCVARNLVFGNPVALIRVHMHRLTHEQKEKRVTQLFSDSDICKMSGLENPFWKAAVLISLHTGLRLSDVAQLEWSCFERPGRIIVWTDKSDARVDLPLPREVERALEPIQKTDPKFVFPEQRAIIRDVKLRSKLSTYFGRELQRLGIEGKSFHGLRHTFATRLAKQPGESIDSIRMRLGHALPATTKIYVH